MKGKILIALMLVIFSIVVDVFNCYAAEARATATILIIIPPREEELEKKVAEMPRKEDKASWEKEVTSLKDERKD